MHVVIIDDDKFCLLSTDNLVRKMLYGSKTTLCSSKEEFVAFINKMDDDIPDLLITDYNIGDFNGIELLLMIREYYEKREKNVPFPTFLLSGNDSFIHLMNEKKSQLASGFINKPLTKEKMKIIISKLIKQNRA
jgi:two-component SAPR family response regulator